MNVISIGEVLWDVVGQQEFPGGTALNFAIHLSRLGHRVSFVSAVGDDERGRRMLHVMEQAGLSTAFIRKIPHSPTGWVDVGLNGKGEPEYQIHRPVAYDFPGLTPEQMERILASPVDWIYYGTLQQMSSTAAELTARLLREAHGAKHFYDPNLRAHSYTAELVQRLFAQATVVKLNQDEARIIAEMDGKPELTLQEFCRTYRRRFGWQAVCITRGADGCVLLLGEDYVAAPGYKVAVADLVGAGDAFAAACLHGLNAGWAAPRIADFSNRIAALVASGSGAVPQWTIDEADALQRK